MLAPSLEKEQFLRPVQSWVQAQLLHKGSTKGLAVAIENEVPLLPQYWEVRDFPTYVIWTVQQSCHVTARIDTVVDAPARGDINSHCKSHA